MIAKLVSIVLDALRRKWLAVVVCLAAGIILAVASLRADIPPFVRYRANASVALPSSPIAGLTFACNATTAAAIAADPLATTAPDLLTLGDRATVAADAISAVNARAASFVASCNADAHRRAAAYVTALQRQTADRQRRLAQLDRVLLPAQSAAATVPALTKRQSDLVAQQDQLQPKLAAAQAAASAASDQAAAAAQAGRDELRKADPLWVFLAAQLEKDSQTYATLSSQFRPTFPRVLNFASRVANDRALLAERERWLDQQPLAQSATYRAAQSAVQQAQASAAVAQQQLDQITTQADGIAKQLARVTAPNGTVAAAARQHDALLASYKDLASRFNAAQAQQAQIPADGPFTVLAPAASATATGVPLALLFAAALVALSLLVGILLALLLALLDTRLLTRRKITALYGKPVIATLQPK
jgi:hypothetical protein